MKPRLTHTLSKADGMAKRRKLVSQLRARGNNLDDIYRVLAVGTGKIDEFGNVIGQVINPETDKPYSRATIALDIEAIRAEWKAETIANVEDHVSRQYSEIQEVKKQAWFDRNPDLALKALNLEMKLLGTLAPVKLNIDITIITQLYEAIERTGENPQEVFKRLIERANERAKLLNS